MPSGDRPFTQTRSFHAATVLDPEPHVLTISVQAPTHPIDFSSPRRMELSTGIGYLVQFADGVLQRVCDRTFGARMVGHCLVELKSIDPETGQTRYLLTAMSDRDEGETAEQIFVSRVGYTLLTRGVSGELESYDRVGTNLEESTELGIPTARLRVLLSPEAANRLFQFHHEFLTRGVNHRFVMTADPLTGEGAICTSYAAAHLEAAGLLEPDWQTGWQRHLPLAEELFGDPDVGKQVPIRNLLFGKAVRRWATEQEPHRDLVYYDTTRMYEWILRHARLPADRLPPGFRNHTPIERELERHLAFPVVTVDRRHAPTPTGPIFRTRLAGHP